MPVELSKIDYKKHYFVCTSEQVKAIAQPLRKYGITMFDHFRIYEDNSGIDLTTVPEFCEFYAKNHLYREGGIGDYDSYHDGIYFWDTLETPEILSALDQQCGIGNGVIVVKTYEKYCDQFYFGGSSNNIGLKNFFISHRDVLEVFIEYYYYMAKDLISKASPHSYIFPDDRKESDQMIRPNEFSENELFFLKKKLISKSTSLTSRELQCIYKSALGDTAKIIAENLNIKKKTVDRHLENARKKMGVLTKTALINKVLGFYFNTPKL